jgi:glycine cleavage system pyridoxal-binding protein P
MPFIPHTDDDVREMLGTIGVERIEDLFDEIPQGLRVDSLTRVPEGLSEMHATNSHYALLVRAPTSITFRLQCGSLLRAANSTLLIRLIRLKPHKAPCR